MYIIIFSGEEATGKDGETRTTTISLYGIKDFILTKSCMKFKIHNIICITVREDTNDKKWFS